MNRILATFALSSLALTQGVSASEPLLLSEAEPTTQVLTSVVEPAFQSAARGNDESAASCLGGVTNVLAEGEAGATASWDRADTSRDRQTTAKVTLEGETRGMPLVMSQPESENSYLCFLATVSQEMPLLQSVSKSQLEMQKNDTTIAGDQYSTDTCHVDNNGTITMTFKCEPMSAGWVDRVKQQYEGSIGGAKPNGGVTLTNRAGKETANWDILAWHIESFNFPTLDSKDDSQLIQYVTIRVEKFVKA